MRNLSRSLLLVGALALTGGLAACGDDVTVAAPTPTPTPTPKVTAVTVAPSTGTVRIGGTLQLTASVTADSGASPTIAWKTSDATIATVDATGKVTGVKAGTVGITATATANGSSASGSATITVSTTTNVQSISLNPNALVLNPGQTQGITAVVTLDPSSTSSDRGVNWSTSDATIATVSASGVVTALKPGNAIITAAAKADTNSKATASVTVRTPAPTQISIQSITAGGLQTPVNVNNVAGQIDVTLNVDPGDNVISRVEVLIDGNVVCTQQFSGAQSNELKVAAAVAQAAPVPIVCSINTALFDSTGKASFVNGPHQLSARAITSTGTQVATPSTTLIFNNASGFAVAVTNVAAVAGASASAVDPRTGLGWKGGDVTVRLVPVSYAQGQAITTLNVASLFGKTTIAQLTPAANGAFSVTFTAGTAWTATNLGIGNYTTPCQTVATCLEAITIAASTLTNGTTGPTTVLNAGAAAAGNPLGFPALSDLRVDNSAPGVLPANFPTAWPAFAITPIALTANPIWVNSSTAFAAGQLGVPSAATLNSFSMAGATGVEPGVDAVTATFFVGQAGTLTGASGSCNLTGLTQTTTGGQLAATIVSTTYQARVAFTDALGNRSCQDLPNTFGADFTPPTFTLTGPGANSIYTGAGVVPSYAVSASDNASGFSATPLQVLVNRLAPGQNECVYGSAAGCINAAAQPLTFNITTGATNGGQGYYTTTVTLLDQAGNATTVLANNLTLVDATQPTIPGGVSVPGSIVGNQPVSFTVSQVSDNLDLNQLWGVVNYPGAAVSIRYPALQLGSFGLPFETTASNVNYSVQNFIHCLNPAGNLGAGTNQPNQITFTVSDQAGLLGSQVAAIPQANVGNCAAVGDVAILTLGQNVPSNATISRDGATANTPTTTSLSVTATVPLNTSNNPFPRVEFYYTDANGNLRLIGQATAALTQTQTTRSWTYTLVWDPAAPVPTGAVTVTAIGVDSNGNGVLTNTQTVTIQP